MLRDRAGRPVGDPDWFVRHGTDVETVWSGPVPTRTPNDRFYVRNHTTAPEIDATTWRLDVRGDGVAAPRSFSLSDLQALPTHAYERAVECTGNGRSLFESQQGGRRPGTPWGLGAIGVARWRGVRLATLLEVAGLLPDAVQVMPVGLDPAYVVDGVDHGHVRRPLPIAKALDDVLVAWEMNDEPLPRDHGHPARLVVPGWVGIASIKWLGALEVTTARVDSPWSTTWYRMHGAGWEGPDAELGRMPVKSVVDEVGRPTVGVAGLLRGRAWAGEAAVRAVEVSTDGGRTWALARLVGDNEPSSWTTWELPWTPVTAGEHVLVTRATDTWGRTQPGEAPDNDDGYLFWACVRQPVTVAPERTPDGSRDRPAPAG